MIVNPILFIPTLSMRSTWDRGPSGEAMWDNKCWPPQIQGYLDHCVFSILYQPPDFNASYCGLDSQLNSIVVECTVEMLQHKHCSIFLLAPVVDSNFILALSTAVRDRRGGRGREGGRERYCWIWALTTLWLSKGSSLFSLKCVCECGQDFGSCPDAVAQLKSPDKRHFLKFRLCVCVFGIAQCWWLNALPAV